MADYYIAEDGDDGTGDGSSGNPYATMAPFTETAGDTCHFRGNLRFTLYPLTGSDGSPITYQQWSGQDQAIFNGADVESSWTGPDGNSEYYATNASKPIWVVDDGAILTEGTVGSLAAGEWGWDAGNTRVYVKDDPTSATMEISTRTYGIQCSSKSWFDLTGLEVRYTENDGINIASIASGNVNITDCASKYTRYYNLKFYSLSGGTHVIDNFEADTNKALHGIGIYALSGSADVTLQNSSSHDIPAGHGLYTGSNSGGTFLIDSCSLYSNDDHGLYAATLSGGTLTIQDSSFYSNTQHGIYFSGVTGGDVDLRRNKVYDNTQYGIYLLNVTAANSFLAQFDLLYDNGATHAGLYLNNADDVEIYRCTFVDEYRGIYLAATSTGCDIDGCIVEGSTNHGYYALTGSSPSIDYCCGYDNTTNTYQDATTAWAAGTGNITTDPDFDDPASDDYHIPNDSPCRDTGVVKAGTSTTDLDGEPADQHVGPDMGCYEYQPSIVYADIDGGEVMQGTSGAAASQVVALIGPIQLTADDYLRVQGKFDAEDAGTNWLSGKCTVSIHRVGD